jgi:hypothetical protein
MKMRSKSSLVLGLVLILTLLLAACRPAVQTPPPSQFQPGEATPTVEAGGEPGTGGEIEPGGEPSTGETGVAEDIPLPEGYYDANVSSDGGQIVYKVGGSSEEVVQYYQDTLPEFGWEMAGPADTVIGNTALMLRENSDADRLSINMQYNPNAGFTVVTLVITRKTQN